MPVAKQHVLIGALVAVASAAVFVMWPRNTEALQAPPPLPAAQIAEASDGQAVFLAVSELRWSMAGDASRQAKWRELPAIPRTVLALSWVENGDPAPRREYFPGFGQLLAMVAPNRPTPMDLAEAYDAIGAPEMAAVCRDAQAIVDRDPATTPGPADFAGPDRDFRRIRAEGSPAKLLAYVRQHAADIAAVRTR